jgi:hypothetical protein
MGFTSSLKNFVPRNFRGVYSNISAVSSANSAWIVLKKLAI